MARTINEIKQSMIEVVQNNPTLSVVLTATSSTDIWQLMMYVVASAIYLLEVLFDTHKAETDAKVRETHNLLWYRNKMLTYQHGYSLEQDSDTYATIDEDAQIIKYSNVTEVVESSQNILKIKAAKEDVGSLAAFSEDEYTAISAFINRFKDAGVKFRLISQVADSLRLVISLHYDPLVFDEDGVRLDGTNNTPVQDAITSYLQNLPFDGEFSIMALTDALQIVDGVKIPQILSAETKWGGFDWQIIQVKHNPEAGWYECAEADLTINWVAHEN